MTRKQDQLARVVETGIVAVIRSSASETLVDVAQALLSGGVEVMEITFTVPGAIHVLQQVGGPAWRSRAVRRRHGPG